MHIKGQDSNYNNHKTITSSQSRQMTKPEQITMLTYPTFDDNTYYTKSKAINLARSKEKINVNILKVNCHFLHQNLQVSTDGFYDFDTVTYIE